MKIFNTITSFGSKYFATIFCLFCLLVFLGSILLDTKFLKPFFLKPLENDVDGAIRISLFTFGFTYCVIGYTVYKFSQMRDRYNWLASVVQKNHAAQLSFPGPIAKTAVVPPAAWPWGEHHTEMLGHLSAAASRFWVHYDPTDPTTAPTNEMVSDWLRTERSVSRDKAQAIASILRADGLRTGPRR